MNEAVFFVLERCSRKRAVSFLDRFGVDAESVETSPERISRRSSIDSLEPENLNRLRETAEEMILLASEPDLDSTQWASFLCGNPVWDVLFWQDMPNIEKILELWLTDQTVFDAAVRLIKLRAVPPSLITPDMAY